MDETPNKEGKNEDNQSFTFEHYNPGTSSMKSISNNMASPVVNFGSLRNAAKNGNLNSLSRSPLNFGQSPNLIQGIQKDSNIMKMLNEIGEIGDVEESFAATKAAIKGKASDLVQEDTEKQKKRKEKLKKKAKGLKVDIPSKNIYIPEAQGGETNEKLSPFRKLYTPTPTKKLINMNVSDTGGDPYLFFNQQSKNTNGIPKINMESPCMFWHESRGNGMMNTDNRFGTPNRFMSPGSQYANPDMLKYNIQLSNGMFMPDNNRDSAFIMNVKLNNNPNKESEQQEDRNNKDI
jgi:DNA-binding FrmR family transcriptional regulator